MEPLREDEELLVRPERNTSTHRSLAEHLETVRDDDWRLDVETAFAPFRHSLEGEGDEAQKSRGKRGEKRNKKLEKFYRRQNDQIDAYVNIDKESRGLRDPNQPSQEEIEEIESRRLRGVQIAIYGSFILNVALFLAKIVAVVLSGSISLIASAVDSFLDLISGSIIFITSLLMKRRRSIYLYPAGNTRIEPIGIIIFASAMFVATFQIIVQAIQKIIEVADLGSACPDGASGQTISQESICNVTCSARTIAGDCQTLTLDTLTISIICSTVAVKLLMFLYCVGYRAKSSSVRALATDHISDVVSNSILLACYVFSYFVWGYMDPIGGLGISFYLQFNWYGEGKKEVLKLSGQSAPPEFLSQLTFLTWNHSRLIVAVDTVRAYHLANGYLVEVDIVLPHDMTLKEAHDIGESLQLRLEAFEEVERAFVHLDYETEHDPSGEHPAMRLDALTNSFAEEDDSTLEKEWDLGQLPLRKKA